MITIHVIIKAFIASGEGDGLKLAPNGFKLRVIMWHWIKNRYNFVVKIALATLLKPVMSEHKIQECCHVHWALTCSSEWAVVLFWIIMALLVSWEGHVVGD